MGTERLKSGGSQPHCAVHPSSPSLPICLGFKSVRVDGYHAVVSGGGGTFSAPAATLPSIGEVAAAAPFPFVTDFQAHLNRGDAPVNAADRVYTGRANVNDARSMSGAQHQHLKNKSQDTHDNPWRRRFLKFVEANKLLEQHGELVLRREKATQAGCERLGHVCFTMLRGTVALWAPCRPACALAPICCVADS